MPFAVGISLNSPHVSALTCLVSSFKEKASFCVWSVTPWQRLPSWCVWCLLSLPAALLFLNSEGLHHEIWDQVLRRTRPVTAAHPFQNSGRALLSKGGGGFFSFPSKPFQGVCGRKPYALVPLSSGVKLWSCRLCQHQLWGFLINNRVKTCKLILNINFL